MKYKHLFFDLDHTLWDGHRSAAESIAELYDRYNMEQYGIASAEDLVLAFHEINYHLWEEFEHKNITIEELLKTRFELLLAKFGISNNKMAANLSSDYRVLQEIKQIYLPYIHEVLSYLQPKYALHVFTNGIDPLSVERKMGGIRHYFCEVIGSYSSGYFKPHAISFQTALAKAGAQAEHSLMIGDSQHTDIIGAINMGMDCVWLNQRKQTILTQATYEISCMSELMQLL